MRKILSVSAFAIAVFFTTSAVAEEQAGGVTISPLVGYYHFDTDRKAEDDEFLGIALGYQFASSWELELIYLEVDSNLDVPGKPDFELEQWRLDALHHFGRKEKWAPYFAFGFGKNDFKVNGGGFNGNLVNAGLGSRYYFTDALALRGDVRSIYSLDHEDLDVAFTLGLHYQFGAKPQKKPPVTLASAQVTPVKPVVRDDDGDGVPNNRDACPDTTKGRKVDARGCDLMVTEERAIELEVNFANNSAQIKEGYYQDIEKLARFMKQFPDVYVVVKGYTDSVGASDYNMNLSKRRAESVARALIDRFDITGKRVSTVGYGETESVANNSTNLGRQKNRRVVAHIRTTVEVPAK